MYFPNNLLIAQTLERVDEHQARKSALFGRFHWQNLTYANGNQVPVSGGYGPANSRNYAFGYTHIITPNLVNDFHYWCQPIPNRTRSTTGMSTVSRAPEHSLGIPGFNYDTTDNMPGIPNVSVY